MSNYLNKNAEYWASPYMAPNVESWIFRFYGRILKFDYGIDGSNHERLLDFGCGQGGALNFFNKLGFNCYGVDISKTDIEAAQKYIPNIANQLIVIDSKPDENNIFFGGGFDIVISIQTLDWLSNTDFDKAIKCLYNNMKPGAKIYASFNAWDNYYRSHGEEVGDGLWHVRFKTKGPLANKNTAEKNRKDYDLFLNFVKDKEEMKKKFSLFEPVYLDEYNGTFREEGSEHRYTFFGIKK